MEGELDDAQGDRRRLETPGTPAQEQTAHEAQGGEEPDRARRVGQLSAGQDMARGAKRQASGSTEQTRPGPPQPGSRSAHRHNLCAPYAVADAVCRAAWSPGAHLPVCL
ncbi:hypothetical protein GCM10010347_64940 [Streptomyces cirratus]|uniref:Uncharacterized protein n=1 Tax=Streptomyces cirratus TaxID=68187 RepID=A0ABQ3F5C4_9ACTN|nr:hypothetical protein GCM10010347_64940 [Streptomyces cirratus]